MIPTPDLSHLTNTDFEKVYEPAEDTFLLLDALEEDAKSLKSINPGICLEVGSGSGCVTSFLGKVLGPSVLYLCTDINPHACRCTLLTGRQNQVDVNVVNGSLTTPFQNRLAHKIDVIVFNPPYVPTLEKEASDAQHSGNIGGAWAGGTDGMRITNVLLRQIDSLLSSAGRFYLVALKQNNIPEIIETMQDQYNLTGEVLLQRRAGREHLFIICFKRQSSISLQ
ncbi:S-adenosyl-L-methionine-dependent methyltransferase [Gymnopilus junonius]|uniref:S-adenosyl-L-methionine-dependent methyltransferase n=1 Tax=Gymnopilus junonius TaxID=109634 RepID=A0A9P5NSZ2_GYMJU|nr:S-adenosyl-L-methionine-dependent methyltransferase [Gymnopilus junonius]